MFNHSTSDWRNVTCQSVPTSLLWRICIWLNMLQSSPKRSKVHKRAHKSSGCGLFLSNWWQVLSCVFRSNRLKCRQFVFHKYSLSAAPENHCTLYPSRSQMDTFVVCLQGIYSFCFHVINVCRKIEFRRCMCYEKWIHITPTSLWHDMIS